MSNYSDNVILPDAPVRYWPMDEASGTTMFDRSGNGLNGTYYNGVTLGQAGIVPCADAGTCARFTAASSQYAQVFDTGATRLTTYSIEFWVKQASTGQQTIIEAYASASGQRDRNVFFGSVGGGAPSTITGATVRDAGDVGVLTDAEATVASTLDVHHVVMTFNAVGTVCTEKLYIDGVLVATSDNSTFPANTHGPDLNSSQWDIGRDLGIGGTWAQGYLDAWLQHLAIYDYELSPTQVAAHFSECGDPVSPPAPPPVPGPGPLPGVGGGGLQEGQGNYSLIVADRFGNELDEVPIVEPGIQYTYTLNGPGAISWTSPLRHPKLSGKAWHDLMAPGARELHLYRGGNLYWGGRLWTGKGKRGNSVDFAGEGYFSILRMRHVSDDLVWVDADQLDIVWDLIAYTQSKDGGDIGISRFSTGLSGVTRSKTVSAFERQNVGQLITDISELENGFDWEVTADKTWRTWYPHRGQVVNAGFATGKNVVDDWDYSEDGKRVATNVTAIGGASGNTKLIADAIAVGEDFDLYGLLQASTSHTNLETLDLLQAAVIEDLQVSRRVQPEPGFGSTLLQKDMPLGSFNLGDRLYITLDAGWASAELLMRLTQFTVNIPKSGVEKLTPVFDVTVIT